MEALKLMVVGRGEAGKSATIDSLLGKPFQPARDSTVGTSTEECFSVARELEGGATSLACISQISGALGLPLFGARPAGL